MADAKDDTFAVADANTRIQSVDTNPAKEGIAAKTQSTCPATTTGTDCPVPL